MPPVSVFNAHRKYRISHKRVEGYVQRVTGVRKSDISVIFVDSRYCKSINKKYLNHNSETDVISFTIETKPVLEGEIYINLDQAKKQAEEFGVNFSNEVARLVVHGALHLIGYDDKTKRDRQRMNLVQERHVRHWFPVTQRKRT